MASREFFWSVLEVFAAAILLIPAAMETLRYRKIGKDDRILLLLILSTTLVLLSGAASRYILGKQHLTLLFCFLTGITYASMLACICWYTQYVLAFIRLRADIPRAYSVFVFAVSIVLATVNFVFLLTEQSISFDPVTYRPSFGFASSLLIFLAIIPMSADIMMLLRYRKALGFKKTAVFLCFMLLPILGLPLSLIWNTVPAQLFLSLSALVIYSMVHANQNDEAVEQKTVLNEDRAKLVFSQMQPHFMFNALDTIYYLCDADVELAKKATCDFSDYLRVNLNVSEFQKPVPFETELLHTKKYLSLEKLRFEERLQIVWDIRTKNFCLPMLTMQPLVENAVKHGVNKRKEGGTVTIRTRNTAHGFCIVVADNGVGFDTTVPIQDKDDRTHIGIAGVRRCLDLMSGGTLEIKSKPGVGTTAIIQLPKSAAVQEVTR